MLLNELNKHLTYALPVHGVAKRRLITFKIQVAKSPRPYKKWSLNTSFEPTYFNKIAPIREKDLTVI